MFQEKTNPFNCLYCGNTEYVQVDHWKVCTECKHNKDFLAAVNEIVNALEVYAFMKKARENARDPRGRPSRARREYW